MLTDMFLNGIMTKYEVRMKVNIERIENEKEEQVLIRCFEINSKVNEIIDFVKSRDITLSGMKDAKIYSIFLQDIFYIESVDNKVFTYLEDDVYELKYKLYEFERMYEMSRFFRCSKSVIVNLMKIESFKPALNGRFTVKLLNGEDVIISRQYVSQLKNRLKGGII